MTFPRADLQRVLATSAVFTDGDWVESKDQDVNGDVRLIQLADVGTGEFIDKSSRFLTSAKAEQLRCTFLESGDVLVARMPDPIGRACIFPGGAGKSVTVVDVCIIRADPEVVDPRWLMHCLNSPGVHREITRRATGTTRLRISRGNLGKVQVPYPAVEQQRRISQILDQAEALRVKRRAAIALLDDLARSIFLDMFGDPAVNPYSFPETVLGKVGEVQGGLQVSGKREDLPVTVPYLRVANVHRNRLAMTEVKELGATEAEVERTRLCAGDILVVEGHGNPQEIGRAAIWDGSIDPCVHQNHLIRVRLGADLVIPEFAAHYINSEGGRRHLLSAARTTSGLNTISVSVVKKCPIALPPIEQQYEFAKRLAVVEKLKSRHRAHLSELDTLFSLLQHRAFRDELWRESSVPVI